jgi:AcrR family transcriptional regulator
MSENIKKPWILVGYDLFSQHGLSGLKIEVMAKKVAKSKSSFYHHFTDVEVFTEVLLNAHLERAKIIADRERACKNMVPDLLNLLLDIKQDLLFNRQLRVNRHIPDFKKCLDAVNLEFEDVILGIWSEALGLGDKRHLARIVLRLTIDNFFLQITDKTLTYNWLLDYFNQINGMVKEFRNGNN